MKLQGYECHFDSPVFAPFDKRAVRSIPPCVTIFSAPHYCDRVDNKVIALTLISVREREKEEEYERERDIHINKRGRERHTRRQNERERERRDRETERKREADEEKEKRTGIKGEQMNGRMLPKS